MQSLRRSFARDAYAILQVVPTADAEVITAAFRVLARRFHPDGATPDVRRMSRISEAYSLVRNPDARARYDDAGRPPLDALDASDIAYDPWGPGTAETCRGRQGMVLDFGRYAGWSVDEVAHRDPDYLRWLSRHSSGLRFRDAIVVALGSEIGVGRTANVLV